jgi:hypothetical protein
MTSRNVPTVAIPFLLVWMLQEQSALTASGEAATAVKLADGIYLQRLTTPEMCAARMVIQRNGGIIGAIGAI